MKLFISEMYFSSCFDIVLWVEGENSMWTNWRFADIQTDWSHILCFSLGNYFRVRGYCQGDFQINKLHSTSHKSVIGDRWIRWSNYLPGENIAPLWALKERQKCTLRRKKWPIFYLHLLPCIDYVASFMTSGNENWANCCRLPISLCGRHCQETWNNICY